MDVASLRANSTFVWQVEDGADLHPLLASSCVDYDPEADLANANGASPDIKTLRFYAHFARAAR